MISRSFYVNVIFDKLKNKDKTTIRELCEKIYGKLKAVKAQNNGTDSSNELNNNDGLLIINSFQQEKPERSPEFYETGLEFRVVDEQGSKLDLVVTVNDTLRFLGLAEFKFGSNDADDVDKLVQRVNKRVKHFLTSEKYIGVLVRKLHRCVTDGDDTTTECIWQWVYTDVWFY
ncbi:unnamed protein product [Ambrosiozyma monospora]|uniref:Unnamed protein product n=1 Tax=Ambrosiozyma monospora TaxID=43982 RepID=A0ACB5U6M7_AMBMO|nr:unnamed protein product [Ambrosiozyma monospora]